MIDLVDSSERERDGAGFTRFDTVMIVAWRGWTVCSLVVQSVQRMPADASPVAASERAPHYLCRRGPSISRFLGI